jgi:hypothetical protein
MTKNEFAALPTMLAMLADLALQDSPTITTFPEVVGAASVQATPVEALVWLQFVLDPETKAMAPHAGVEQRKARTRIRRLVKVDTPRSWLCWSWLAFWPSFSY